MLQRYSFSNNYHIRFLSDGWSEHLCCGIVHYIFGAREIYLKVWVQRTKTYENLSQSFSTIDIVSSGASLLFSNCKDYF